MRVVKVLSKWIAVVVGLLVILVAYIGIRGQVAATRVREFCDGVRVGQPVAKLAADARERGLTVTELPERDDHPAVLICLDGVLLARHTCDIEHSGGVVITAVRSFVD